MTKKQDKEEFTLAQEVRENDALNRLMSKISELEENVRHLNAHDQSHTIQHIWEKIERLQIQDMNLITAGKDIEKLCKRVDYLEQCEWKYLKQKYGYPWFAILTTMVLFGLLSMIYMDHSYNKMLQQVEDRAVERCYAVGAKIKASGTIGAAGKSKKEIRKNENIEVVEKQGVSYDR